MKFKNYLDEDQDNRYVVSIDMYVYAKDDKDVIKQAQKIAKELQRKDDNDAEVTEIVQQDFGTIGNRKVKI